MANRCSNSGSSDTFYFWGSKVTVDGDCSHEMKRCLLVGRKAVTDLKSVLKSRDITLLTKGPSSQSYGFSSSPVQMQEFDHKASCCWRMAFKLWCWRRLLRVPWTARIKWVNPEGNHPCMFIGRTDAKAPIFWLSDEKSWLIGKDPDAGKYWRQKEKGMTEDVMVR